MFAPHNPHQYECDGCELAAMRADRAAIDAMEDLEFGRALSDAFFDKAKAA